MSAPLVSIVTPCLNQARFLEETIESVLSQDYPNIEYIVMDGASTDHSLEILKRYEGRLRYSSEADSGAADAINRGFELSRGEVFGFLGADDTYLPGAVSTAIRAMMPDLSRPLIYGDALWVDEGGQIIGPYPTKRYDADLLSRECFICQPAAFIRRDAFERAGGVDPALRFVFDYDLWIRLSRLYPIEKIDVLLATSRMHRANKTLGQRRAALGECLRMLRERLGYVPFQPVHAYASHLVDGCDQFSEPSVPSVFKYLLSLPVGLRHNPWQPLRFFREWAAVATLDGLRRRVSSFLGAAPEIYTTPLLLAREQDQLRDGKQATDLLW